MKFLINGFAPLAFLLCVIFVSVSQAEVDFKGPIDAIVGKSLSTISLASKLFSNPGSLIGGIDFLASYGNINNKLKNVNIKTTPGSLQLPGVKENYLFFGKMRIDLEELRAAVAHNFKTILNPKKGGVFKDMIMNAMTDYTSSFRKNLDSFVRKYINPQKSELILSSANLFYDYVLKSSKNATLQGDDGYDESVHTRILKSYMFLLETLSDAYAMALSAHALKYQKELKTNLEDALATRSIALRIIDRFKTDVKALGEKTTWAMEEASRDVRKRGTFEYLIKGDTFYQVPFAYKLPFFNDTMFTSLGEEPECFTMEEHVQFSDFEITSECTNGGLTAPGELRAYINPNNTEWPYSYVKNQPHKGSTQILGSGISLPNLEHRTFIQTNTFYTLFCDAFKKEAVGISMAVAKVAEGSIITGVRLAVRNNTIYLEVREGNLLDDLTVDPLSSLWVSPEESTDIVYLNTNIRRFELGDMETKDNKHITSIQFVFKDKDQGIIGLSINGETTELIEPYPIDLYKKVSPLAYGADVKNQITKVPVPSKPYFVSLQASDLEKELGSATIPFFDTRAVVTYPESPIVGVGLYHQAAKISGGFISIRVKQPRWSKFVDTHFIEKTISS